MQYATQPNINKSTTGNTQQLVSWDTHKSRYHCGT